jgi:hypothetical protein
MTFWFFRTTQPLVLPRLSAISAPCSYRAALCRDSLPNLPPNRQKGVAQFRRGNRGPCRAPRFHAAAPFLRPTRACATVGTLERIKRTITSNPAESVNLLNQAIERMFVSADIPKKIWPNAELAVMNWFPASSYPSQSRVASAAPPLLHPTGAVGDTTATDPRSRRNRIGRRDGRLLTRALGSLNTSSCPLSYTPGSTMFRRLGKWSNINPEKTGILFTTSSS